MLSYNYVCAILVLPSETPDNLPCFDNHCCIVGGVSAKQFTFFSQSADRIKPLKAGFSPV